MTVPNIKVKVVRKPSLKVKVLPRFPSSVTATDPIILTKTGGSYAFSFDVNALPASLATFFLPVSYDNFTQRGTGAVTYGLTTKIGQVFSARDYGCKGDGTTADAANLNRAIAAVIALGAGELWIPAGTYKCDGTTIIADLSAIATRFQGRIVIRGDGAATVIQNTTSAAACFKFLGNTTNSESYFELRNIRFKGAASSGAAIAGSKGVEIDVCAFAQVRGVIVEGFEYGHDCTDVEQLEFSNCEFRWNKNGGVFRGVGSITDTNSVLITNCQYSNNALTGLTLNHGNLVKILGGSNQYNGLVGGPSNTGGLFLQEAGTGYGAINIDSVAFEGNGGIGDVDSLQSTNPAVITFQSCSFIRTQTFGPTVGYGTNNINIRGTNANTTYVLTGNTFRFFSGYTESAARPTIALANTSCKISDDGTNYFQSATEKLTYPVGQLVDPAFGNLTVRGTLNALGNGGFGGTLNVGGASTLGARITGPSGVAAVAYFVTPTGNDGNTGLSSGAACLTLQGVWTKAMLANNGSGGVTINIADGTYTNSLSINGAWNGAGPITIVGNVGSPANVLLSVTSDNAIRVKNANVIISGMEIRTATAGDCLLAYDGGEISFSNMRFGACAGSHLTAQFAGRIHGTGNYTISGSAVSHLHAFARGYISLVGLTVTLTGTPAFSAYFAGVADASIGMSGVTFSGAATGKRFLAHDGGRIDTSGLGISGLPGSIAGTFDTWGQYDGVFSGTGDITGATAFFTNNVNATGFVGGTAANAVATLASTSSGAPSGDILNLVGSTVNLNGVPFKAAATAANGQLPGTATNDNASTGNVGEYVSSIVVIGSAVSISNDTPKTVTSISLTAGDWDVRAICNYFPANTTTLTSANGQLSLANDTADTTPGRAVGVTLPVTTFDGSSIYSIPIPNYRFSLSTTTTIYLIARAKFAVSTNVAYGILSARRIR